MERRPAHSVLALALAAGVAIGAVALTPEPPVELTAAAEPAVVLSESAAPLGTVTTTTSTTTTLPPTTSTTAPPAPPSTEAPKAERPPAEVAPPQTINSGGCAGWEPTIAAHFPPEVRAKACSVLLCESRGDPGVANEQGSGASGLWQFLDSTWVRWSGLPAPASAYSGDTQTAAAAALWRADGWRQWSCA